ncbi:MAG: hypothetical protein U1F11_13285 [Steroidobacteraceae bacterium]
MLAKEGLLFGQQCLTRREPFLPTDDWMSGAAGPIGELRHV